MKILKTLSIPIEKGGLSKNNFFFQTHFFVLVPFYKPITRFIIFSDDEINKKQSLSDS